MNELFGAILFTVFIASAALGLASVICALLPATTTENEQAQAREKLEYAFFGFAGIIIALVMVLAMVFQSS